MFSAALLIEYDTTAGPNVSALATLPSVLEMFRIFLAVPFSRNGSTTCESSAGATAFVRRMFSVASGSMLNGLSSNAYVKQSER